ncbi:amino acid ABC transporter [Virgisporangium aliadipatigenens]|uniref:Amino acid ABC transporter n=1 Tax=Virgisporangium aliadipatigenens TaxID=741659 RepID=A0A8J4DP52_9ACTN|nr:transporter substrate-binding domain-containing protein [Virgisporangium aliadipatigenens]GIJ45159.1 amino acid ABC transporter [Virgisporangium aliadipatigenens]
MRLRALLSLPLAALLFLPAACGDGDDDNKGTTGAAAKADPALNASLPEAIKKAGVIRFAGDSHPPYRIVGPDGKTVTGIDREIQEALGAVLGVKTEIEIVAGLPAALTGMQSGRYDAFNGPVKDTAEREKEFDAVVWMVTRTAYLIPKDSKAGIKTSDDLCGKKVAGTSGSIIEDQIKKLTTWCTGKGKPAPTFIGLADTNAIILAAKSGRADAAGMTESAAIDAMAKEKDAYTYVSQTDEQGAGVDQLAMLVPKSSKLGPVILQAFKAIFANGEYKRIMDKYGLQKVVVTEPKMNTAAG